MDIAKAIEDIKSNKTIKILLLLSLGYGLWFICEDFLMNVIAELRLKSKESLPVFIEILILLLSIFTILFQCLKIRISYKSFYINQIAIIYFCSIYIYYRIFVPSTKFGFLKYSFLKPIAYLDSVIILLILSIILLVISLKKKKNKKTNEFHDNPWEEGDSDLLERKPTVEYLAKFIRNHTFTKSFSIAVTGEWGEGKSSFLEMLRVELKKDDIIFLTFNPWIYSEGKLIQAGFLKQLRSKLNVFGSEINPSISAYIEIIASNDKSKLTKVFSDVYSVQTKEYQTMENVKEAIERLNKKIVICIDDLDRLEKNEILEVVKLIRVTANFPNTVFISAFDIAYLNKTLSDFGGYNCNFLDKFFNKVIPLPTNPHSILTNHLKKELLNYYKNIPEITSTIEKSLLFKIDNHDILTTYTGEITEYTSYFIRNLRDVKRLINSFCFNYQNLEDDVCFLDFFHIELIRLKHPEFITVLKEKSLFVGKKTESTSLFIKEEKLEEYLKPYSINAKEAINDILKKLFPKENSYEKDFRSICKQKSFDIYFSNRVFTRIPRKEFNNILNSNTININEKVDEYIKDNRVDDLEEHIFNFNYSVTDFKSIESFNRFFEIVFYLDEKLDIIQFYYLAKFFKKENYESLKGIFGDETMLRQFFVDKFEQKKCIYSKSKFIRAILDLFSNSIFPIDKQDLQKILIENFKYSLREYGLNDNVIKIYHYCVSAWYPELSKNLSKLLYEYLVQYPDYFLKNFIRPYYNTPDCDTFTGDPFTTNIFESYDNFEEFLNEKNINGAYNDIVDFFKKYKENNYNPIVWTKTSTPLVNLRL